MHLDVGVILKINDVVVKDVRHLSSCFCAAVRTVRVVRNDRQNDIIHLHVRIFLSIPSIKATLASVEFPHSQRRLNLFKYLTIISQNFPRNSFKLLWWVQVKVRRHVWFLIYRVSLVKILKYLLRIFQYLNIRWQNMFDNRNLKIHQQKWVELDVSSDSWKTTINNDEYYIEARKLKNFSNIFLRYVLRSIFEREIYPRGRRGKFVNFHVDGG